MRDLDRVRCMGLDAYRDQLEKRRAVLEFLLVRCSDGRRKSFFCLASNLLETEDLRQIRARLEEMSPKTPVKALASLAVQLCREAADRRDVVLKLYKKPKGMPCPPSIVSGISLPHRRKQSRRFRRKSPVEICGHLRGELPNP